MLVGRLKAYIEPFLRDGEDVVAAMAGFRPLSRSMALVALLPLVLGGFAVSTAANWPAWVGGALGGGVGAGVAMWLDQRRARTEHDGKGMSLGLVVTEQRLFILALDTGVFAATVAGIEHEVEVSEITSIETQRMQGSGLKRLGVVLGLPDGTRFAAIPARTERFLEAIGAERS
jgi:hypothetical protein